MQKRFNSSISIVDFKQANVSWGHIFSSLSLNYIDHGQIFVESCAYYCRPPGVATRYSISHSRLILLQLKQIHKINCVIVCRKSGTRESEKNEIGNCKIWPQ